MILTSTLFKVSDNSGAYTASCVKVLGNLRRKLCKIGDLVLVSIKTINRKKMRYKKGMLRLGVVVRTKKKFKRNKGVFLKFDENAIIMVNRKLAPVTKKIKGPIPFEVCFRYKYIATVVYSLIM